MSRTDPLPPTSSGRITCGPDKDDGLVPRTLHFIREQLPAWRDDPRRPQRGAEKGLNSSLCRFLESTARAQLPMVQFQHESLQSSDRTVDIGAYPAAETATVGTRSFSIYEPFMVIECKRLPAPGGKDREREYVSGFHANGSPTGGIQRFKLGLHGGQVQDAAMIGYVEKHDFPHWHRSINNWIAELTKTPLPDGCIWASDEQLGELNQHGMTAECASQHLRSSNAQTPLIHLRHLWVRM